MEVIKDNSCGVIPVYKDPSRGLLFLVINQHGEYWGLTKGHVEEGETILETIRRELEEEVGITHCDIDTKKEFIQKYQFEHEGKIIDRTNIFFIGKVTNTHFKIDGREVIEARWVSLDEALETLTFKNAQDMLQQANDYLLQTNA